MRNSNIFDRIPGQARCVAALALYILLLTLPANSMAAEPSSTAAIDFFESKIRPVLVEHCYPCHSSDAGEQEGGLLLDTRAGIRRGGDSGPAVTPGKFDESLLLDAIRYESFEMPPSQKLPQQIISDFEQWIRLGAIDPREGGEALAEADIDLEKGRQFWAFQPPRMPDLPTVQNVSWPRTEIDRFILATLEENGLSPAADTDRYSLLRRVYFTLIGLPPSPDELEAFAADPAPLSEAIAGVVDRLLESEHFGERWGRHWLDVVRYADSSGGGRSALFQHAWRYRDYVIDAFNEDLPFDEFVREQIAGDLMDNKDWQERRRRIIATAFLVLGPTNFELQDKEVLEMDIADEQLDTLGKALMGMTLGCARCHDHKFDPIPTRDYYAMVGILKSTLSVHHENVSVINTAKLPLPSAEEDALRAGKKKLERLQRKLNGLKSEERADPTKEIKQIETQIAELKARQTEQPAAMAVIDKPKPDDISLAIRGVARHRGPVIPRGVMQVCSSAEFPQIVDGQSGRMELAQWLTSPSHPLTARVMVNRVWYWVFGAGLVRTVDNFGVRGDLPSHPELLDYLAVRFVDEGWSVKQLIREMLLSRTFAMSTKGNRHNPKLDSSNRWLSRMNRQRLDAESIRDTLLLLCGQLDFEAGGPAIAKGTTSEYGYVFASTRRSVYLPVFRNQLPSSFEAFDFADPNIQAGSRMQSTTVPQAHFLMNNPLVLEVASNAAKQLIRRSDLSDSQRLDFVFLQVLGRRPSVAETRLVEQLLSRSADELQGWSMLYHTLLQSVDFRFLN